jgi:hypothetical protein
LIEGLFGIQPDALKGELSVKPVFPSEWNFANLRHPDFNFSFQREKLREIYVIEPRFPKPAVLHLNIPALHDQIARVTINGQTVKWKAVEDSIGTPRIEIESANASRYEVEINWRGAKLQSLTRPELSLKTQKSKHISARHNCWK